MLENKKENKKNLKDEAFISTITTSPSLVTESKNSCQADVKSNVQELGLNEVEEAESKEDGRQYKVRSRVVRKVDYI